MQPIFEDQRKLTTCRSVQKCTEKTISKVIWVDKGALDAILTQINKKIGNRFHLQWYRRRINYQFCDYVTDKANGSRIQPSLFGEDQRPDQGDGGNRAYLSTCSVVLPIRHVVLSTFSVILLICRVVSIVYLFRRLADLLCHLAYLFYCLVSLSCHPVYLFCCLADLLCCLVYLSCHLLGHIVNLDWTVYTGLWTLDPGPWTQDLPPPKKNYPKKITPKSPSLPPFKIMYKKEREKRITFYGNKDKSKKHFTLPPPLTTTK